VLESVPGVVKELAFALETQWKIPVLGSARVLVRELVEQLEIPLDVK
jgi:hypothetical protein